MKTNIRGVFNVETEDEEEKKGRLYTHKTNKIKDTKKHDHWCFKFTEDNINPFSAMIVFVGHTVRCPSRVTKTESLLRHLTSSFVHTIDEKWEGCYLYYDFEIGEWRRSGKAVGSDTSKPRAGLVNRD
mmetsp:Transcript_19333/g.23927  ORF Transcript_19333/g.23927 Transcript_19333/m.23927 type:complete len:128 (+) Transcript_19333:331-714(+)